MALVDGLLFFASLDSNGNDAVGGLTGTVTGAAQTTGKLSNCYSFDNIDDNISYGDVTTMDGLSTFSVQAWINPTADADILVVFGKQDATNQTFSVQVWSDNTVAGAILGSIAQQTTPTVTDGAWTHVVWCYDNGSTTRCKIYLNGASQALGTNTVLGATPNSAANLKIGIQDWATFERPFNGLIDEVGFWNRVLTADEVIQLYRNGNGLAHPFPVLMSKNMYLKQGFS